MFLPRQVDKSLAHVCARAPRNAIDTDSGICACERICYKARFQIFALLLLCHCPRTCWNARWHNDDWTTGIADRHRHAHSSVKINTIVKSEEIIFMKEIKYFRALANWKNNGVQIAFNLLGFFSSMYFLGILCERQISEMGIISLFIE